MNEDEILNRAIYTNGATMQCMVAMEECGELVQAISKCIRYNDKNARDSVIEEIADVEICIRQLKMIMRIDEKEIDTRRREKLMRLKDRLQ